MKTSKLIALTFIIIGTALSAISVASNDAPSSLLFPAMRKNFFSLMELQKLSLNPEQFKSKANHEKVAASIKELNQNTTHIKKILKNHGKNGLHPIAEIYADYVQDMSAQFETGNKEYVRRKVPAMTHLCLSCHTGISTKKQFQEAGSQIKTLALNDYEKVALYAATRQFDAAIAQLEKILAPTPLKPGELRKLTQAVKTGMSLAVRVKQDPHTALKLLNLALAKPGLPNFIKEDFIHWKTDLSHWTKQPNQKDLSAQTLLASAKKIIDQAQAAQEYPTDHKADMLYLRASGLLQHTFTKQASFQEKADAFYYLGLCYNALRDPLLWSLDQSYFEACIKNLPHSKRAKECFKALSSEIFFGYTGSSGTHIPPDELARIERMRKLIE